MTVAWGALGTDADHVAEAVEAEFAKSGADQPKLSAVYYVGKPKNSPVIAQFVNTLQRDHCLLYTSPSPRDKRQSRMPSSA